MSLIFLLFGFEMIVWSEYVFHKLLKKSKICYFVSEDIILQVKKVFNTNIFWCRNTSHSVIGIISVILHFLVLFLQYSREVKECLLKLEEYHSGKLREVTIVIMSHTVYSVLEV